MAIRFARGTCLASVAMLAFLSTAQAAGLPPGVFAASDAAPAGEAQAAPTISAREQARMSRAFATQWGNYVQRVYGVEADVWAARMAPSLAQADAVNLANALKRDTFEGAMAELSGSGARLSDEKVIDLLAADQGGTPSPQALGALANDLVYTPVQPCRILDTRSTGAGAIAANSTRNFVAINASSFTSQGGSATNCGTLGLSATVVAINLTAVLPTAAGYATIYPFGTAQPLASNINYVTGSIIANGVLAKIPNPLSSFDFTIYSFAQSHYVADIVGYFAPPVATALQCQDTANTVVSAVPAGGTANANAAACPAGFTQTATNCETSSWFMPIVFSHAGTCSARNNDSTPQDLRASRTCCRIPGR